MKLSYLGVHNPMLTHFGRFSSQSNHRDNGRYRSSSSPSIASTRFQFNHPVPQHLKGNRWQLQPLQKANAAPAYEAYLSNPNALIAHRQSHHLVKSYTWQDHMERMERFELEHQTYAHFSFIVLDKAATKCLGYVHIRPLRSFLHYNNAPTHLIACAHDNSAMLTYWLRSSLEFRFQTQFITTLHQWFTRKWEFPDHFFRINLPADRVPNILESAGLQPHFHLKSPTRHYGFYGA